MFLVRPILMGPTVHPLYPLQSICQITKASLLHGMSMQDEVK